MRKPFMIAEIGINHNGDLNIAKDMIKKAVKADSDAVKFQKRTIDEVYDEDYLSSHRDSPWGSTQREQKEGLEFNKKEYEKIDAYCKELNIPWFASAWDLKSQEFLKEFDLPYNKIASAMLTNKELLKMVAQEGKHTFISTGMSTLKEIEQAVKLFKQERCPFTLMHCNSTYPMDKSNANLRAINTLRKYFQCRVGYSGHETGIVVSLGAVARGAVAIERHVTLDRTMYGSDQAASIVFDAWRELISFSRTLEPALGDGKIKVTEDEKPIRAKLRGA